MSDLPEFLPVDEHFDTKVIHCAFNPADNPTLGVTPPIILSTTYHQSDVTKPSFFKYARFGNPNREMLEKTMAILESGKFASCFSSGIAAIAMVAHVLNSGDHVLSIDDVYRGTRNYFANFASNQGISVTYADLSNVDNVVENMKNNTKLLWLESPTNPLLKVTDLKLIAKKAKKINPNVLVVVDNSFLSPYFLRPLELGADIVACSLTKYINGHSDVMMGCVICNDEILHEKFSYYQGAIGAIPSPFDCYLVMRGLRTLSFRMRAHMCNAFKVAEYLHNHKMVEKLLFPGLSTHPGFEIVQKQWHGVSGMISFFIKGGLKEASYFLKSLKLVTVGLSYGGYESLAELPVLMSHHDIPRDELRKVGITENLIRLSVGLESVNDIIADLEAAFQNVITHFDSAT